jgi:hypothetical protein
MLLLLLHHQLCHSDRVAIHAAGQADGFAGVFLQASVILVGDLAKLSGGNEDIPCSRFDARQGA